MFFIFICWVGVSHTSCNSIISIKQFGCISHDCTTSGSQQPIAWTVGVQPLCRRSVIHVIQTTLRLYSNCYFAVAVVTHYKCSFYKILMEISRYTQIFVKQLMSRPIYSMSSSCIQEAVWKFTYFTTSTHNKYGVGNSSEHLPCLIIYEIFFILLCNF